MRGKNKLVIRIVVTALFIGFLCIGCEDPNRTKAEILKAEAEKILNKHKDEMVNLYINHDQKGLEELKTAIIKKQKDAEIPKQLLDEGLEKLELECKRYLDLKAYTLNIESVSDIQNPMATEVIKILNQQGFCVGDSRSDSVQELAKKYKIPEDQLGDGIIVMHHERAKGVIENLRGALEKLSSASKVKILVKGTPHEFSIGIYLPAS